MLSILASKTHDKPSDLQASASSWKPSILLYKVEAGLLIDKKGRAGCRQEEKFSWLIDESCGVKCRRNSSEDRWISGVGCRNKEEFR